MVIEQDSIRKIRHLFYGHHQTKYRQRERVDTHGSITRYYNEYCVHCMHCKKILTKENSPNKALCQDCDGREDIKVKLYTKKMKRLQKTQSNHGKLWNQCLRCQGSRFKEVKCCNTDCPIWFYRSKMKDDIEDLCKSLKRFEEPL